MLRKEPPPWSSTQTIAVQQLKKLMQDLPPLKIPSNGKRILQTDASDKHWGAVLYEQDEHGKRRICGYKSGTFKDSQLHHHSTFKELLAIKQGIMKFEFHLIGHHFLVETDFAASKGMLKFKPNKAVNTQLLRLAAWFSQFSFDISHIKGKDNVIPDLLSRPPINIITSRAQTIPLIFTITETPNPQSEMASSSSNPNLVAEFPPTFPRDSIKITLSDNPPQKAITRATKTYHTLIRIYGNLMVQDFTFHPQYPFANIFPIRNTWYMPKAVSMLFWYLSSFYTIAVEVHTKPLLTAIRHFKTRPDLHGPHKTQMDVLSWFAPLCIWEKYLAQEWDRYYRICMEKPRQNPFPIQALDGCYTIFLISLNCRNIGNNDVGYAPTLELYGSQEYSLSPMENPQVRKIEKQLFLRNRVIPDEIWPGPEEDAPWDTLPAEYNKKIKRILDQINSPASSSSPSVNTGPIVDLTDDGPNISYRPKEKTDTASSSEPPIRFRSEGLTMEEEDYLTRSHNLYQDSQDPYEDFQNLHISESSPEITQSCTMQYTPAPSETHTVPRPDTQLVWFTDEDWEDPQFRADILKLIDEQEAIQVAEQALKQEELEKQRAKKKRHP